MFSVSQCKVHEVLCTTDSCCHSHWCPSHRSSITVKVPLIDDQLTHTSNIIERVTVWVLEFHRVPVQCEESAIQQHHLEFKKMNWQRWATRRYCKLTEVSRETSGLNFRSSNKNTVETKFHTDVTWISLSSIFPPELWVCDWYTLQNTHPETVVGCCHLGLLIHPDRRQSGGKCSACGWEGGRGSLRAPDK